MHALVLSCLLHCLHGANLNQGRHSAVRVCVCMGGLRALPLLARSTVRLRVAAWHMPPCGYVTGALRPPASPAATSVACIGTACTRARAARTLPHISPHVPCSAQCRPLDDELVSEAVCIRVGLHLTRSQLLPPPAVRRRGGRVLPRQRVASARGHTPSLPGSGGARPVTALP